VLGVCLAVFVLALPAAAEAATFCVPNCPAGVTGTDHPTIPQALTAADGNPGRDTVRIQPGAYDDEQAFAGDPVDIIGGGRERTTLNGPAANGVATLTLGDPASSVSDLRVNAGRGTSTIGLAMQGGTAERVDVGAPEAAFAGAFATAGFCASSADTTKRPATARQANLPN